MNVTARIQELRQKKGWSVARLARESGIPTVSLRAMIARKDPNSWNVSTLEKIAKVLGVSVSYLTMDEAQENKPLLTDKQKQELFEKINNVLEDFFRIEGETEE